MNTYDKGLMWFRRDLRWEDNTALHHALKACRQVWCVFVFDTDILDALPRVDRRVRFLRESLVELDARLRALGVEHGHAQTGLIVLHGSAVPQISGLAERLGVQAVFANHDDEPAARQRDAQVLGHLAHHGTMLHTHKDHVVFERREVLTQTGQPFGVFTPFKNAWLRQVGPAQMVDHDASGFSAHLASVPPDLDRGVPSLAEIGFEEGPGSELHLPAGASGAQTLLADFVHRIEHYDDARNFPAVKGPSYLGVHLRFGTLSVRQALRLAYPLHLAGNTGASTWLSELIWRDFYHQIMANHPHVVERAFKPAYDRIAFEHGKVAKALFSAWCEGRTGYPLVDAAMAQINQCGYMHNRLRMVVASFLVKDLGLHWSWGERYFAEKLMDFDLAANNGGWQWASSSGCDAQPYFRIFNPTSQSEKFDAQGKFIRRYVPQLEGLSDKAIHAPWMASPLELAAADVRLGENYPMPVVDHAAARAATLARYSVVKAAAA